jgi:hypothetical protein
MTARRPEMEVSPHPVDDGENSILADSRSSTHAEVPQEHIASPTPSRALSNLDADKVFAGYNAPDNSCTAVSTQTVGGPDDQPETLPLAEIVPEEFETSDEWYLRFLHVHQPKCIVTTAINPKINPLVNQPPQSLTRLLLQWICDGLSAVGRLPEMLRKTEEQRPDYVSLSETWACPKSFLIMENYALYQSPARRAGGVIILVKQALRLKYLTTIVMAGGQAVLATVLGGIIGYVYAPPRATVAEPSEFIRKLQSFHGAMILAGDWNA